MTAVWRCEPREEKERGREVQADTGSAHVTALFLRARRHCAGDSPQCASRLARLRHRPVASVW